MVGRHLGDDGRKSFTASTLYDADGRVVATAEHVWIAGRPRRVQLRPSDSSAGAFRPAIGR